MSSGQPLMATAPPNAISYSLPGPADYRKPVGGRIDMMKMFPPAFTMACALLFMVPTYMVIYISRSPVITYFSNQSYWILLVIPVIIAASHYVHVRGGVPNKYAVIGSLILPSLLLLIFANVEYVASVDKSDKLFSTDCDTFLLKRRLQNSWEAAYSVYMNCLNQTAVNSGRSIDELRSNFRIQDCSEYAGASRAHSREWSYLQHLEENNHCSGWCYHGVQLWSSAPTKDSCSTVVSSVYSLYVRPHASQICIVMLAVLFLSAAMFVFMGETIRAHGLTW